MKGFVMRLSVSNLPIVLLLLSLLSIKSSARELTLKEAVDIALDHTGRGAIINGQLEVAEQYYFAERINFYVPEISINGSLPSYGTNERWGYLPGTDGKGAVREPYLDFDADITLTQNLITGGDLTVSADLTNQDREHPNREGLAVEESSKLGRFNFSFTQPILQPSAPKYDLANRKDDLEIARLTRVEESAAHEKDVIEAYIGVLQTGIKAEIGRDNYESASLQANIDSMKLADGVISEEDWLESNSSRLDAELMQFEIKNEADEQKRLLAALLDLDVSEHLTLIEPEVTNLISEKEELDYVSLWHESIPIRKAGFEYEKAKRDADYSASSCGLSGNFTASYDMGRGRVEDAGIKEDLKTNSWGVKLEFSYPLWDGGASSASVKAANLSAEQVSLEYNKAEKSAKAEIVSLINIVNVSFRKLDILKQQIGLARTKLDIAKMRFDDGQISELTFLENRISFLQTKDNYLEELKNYFISSVDLRSKYVS
ncbi:MAG: TolC family protein [candidate division Zixibacteria bacterium]|nr:TolC family protein [candidate division Zixibacteria bacterium]